MLAQFLAFDMPKNFKEFSENTWLFFGTIGAAVLLLIIIVVIAVVAKSKKKKKKAQAETVAETVAPVAEKRAAKQPEEVAPAAPEYVAPAVQPVYEPIQQPVYEQPVVEQPVVEQPVVEQPVAVQSEQPEEVFAMPYAEEPVVVQPAVKTAPKSKNKTRVLKNNDYPVADDSWSNAKIKVASKKDVKTDVEDEPEAPVKAAKPAPEKKAAKPAAKKTPKKEPVAELVSEHVEADDDDKPKVVGKYVITSSDDFYQYSLYANNGQLLYESRAYASLASCKSGIETFKKNILVCDYRIDVDKNGGYKYIFKKGNSIYIGESYRTAKAAENSAESVKRFAQVSGIVIE